MFGDDDALGLLDGVLSIPSQGGVKCFMGLPLQRQYQGEKCRNLNAKSDSCGASQRQSDSKTSGHILLLPYPSPSCSPVIVSQGLISRFVSDYRGTLVPALYGPGDPPKCLPWKRVRH